MRSSILVAATLLASVLSIPNQITFNTLPVVETLLDSTFAHLSENDLNQLEAHLADLPEIRKIRVGEKEFTITEGEKAILSAKKIHFVDITDEVVFFNTQAKESFPSKLTYSLKKVEPLFKSISLIEMKSFLTSFSTFYTRYYRSPSGKESQAFLLNYLKDLASTNSNVNVTFSEFPHSWGQNSIIARFEKGSFGKQRLDDLKTQDKVVILGSHQDSTSFLPFMRSPGADDDGSGCTALVTAFKALVDASFIPSNNAVEFHFYSAEEGGLLGSQAVAQSYAAAGKVVRSMSQFDMSAWVKNGVEPTIGVITDFTSPEFSSFVRMAIEEYATIGWSDTACSYACSDHASWTKVNVPSSFTIEATFADSNTGHIHSGDDRIDISPEFSFEHIREFSRLALALAVELGGGDSLA